MAVRNFGSIKLKGGAWIIEKMDAHVCIKLKSVFPVVPKTKPLPYSIPNTDELCNDIEWFISRYPLQISSQDLSVLKSNAKRFRDVCDEMETILCESYTPRPIALKEPYSFRLYQNQFVDLFRKSKRMINGDEVGLGKTIEAIGAMLIEGTLPAIVVVQTHLVAQWREKIETMTNLKTQELKGQSPYKLESVDVYIIRYSVIAHWIDVLKELNPKLIVFDECQELRKTDSEKYRASKAVAQNCEFVLGLSATPIYNYGDEIWNIMNIIKPNALGSSHDFDREWCGNSNRVTNPEALGTYLRSNFLMLRRTAKEVGRQLPEVNRIIQTVDFDKKEIEKMEADAKVLALQVLQGSFIERGKAARELDLKVRQATGISKAKYVAQFVKILLANNEPVVLGGWHRQVYEIWKEEFKEFNPVFYTGTEGPSEKEKSKKKFVSGQTNLIILSLRSGVGLDELQYRSRYVVFGELDWSPGVHHQFIGRVNRDGQENQVTAIFCVSNSGSDPLVVDMLGLKASQAAGIVDPHLGVQSHQSDDSRIKLLAERFLQRGGV